MGISISVFTIDVDVSSAHRSKSYHSRSVNPSSGLSTRDIHSRFLFCLSEIVVVGSMDESDDGNAASPSLRRQGAFRPLPPK